MIGLPARGVHPGLRPETQGALHQDLLVGKGRGDLGHVHLARADAGLLCGDLGGTRAREVAHAQVLRLADVFESPDPRGPAGELARPVPGGQHDRRGAVGDRGAVVPPQRRDQIGLGEQLLHLEVSLQLGEGVVLGVPPAAHGSLCHLPLTDHASFQAEPRLECGDRDSVRPQRHHRVGIELHSHRAREVAHRGLAEAVDQGHVGMARLDLHPGLVEGPGPVHLDVALAERGPGAHRVEARDEGEGLARQVVAGPRAHEVQVLAAKPGAGLQLVKHRDQDLHLVAVELAAHAGRLAEGDDGDVSHQMCSLYES